MMRWLLWAWLVASTALAAPVHAHAPSTSYLTIEPGRTGSIALIWQVALRDLDALLELDANVDGQLTWGEVDDRAQDVIRLAQRSLVIAARDGDVPCPLAFEAPRLQSIDGSGFLVLSGRAACAAADRARLTYGLFAGIDPSHRALIRLSESSSPVSLAPNDSLTLAARPDAAAGADSGFAALFIDGVGHILGGLDHLLFLVALMLPAVVERRAGRWIARADLRVAVVQVAWIATAFTVAHSITLALASFGWVRVSAAVIEPLIAVTVLAAALNNIWPLVTTRLALAAFFFGLIHGFGFAEVLMPLELPAPDLARALLAFNLGVEGGQLIVVAASFALLALARHWRGYPRWILGGGSAALAFIAAAWIAERVFGVVVLPA